MHGDLKCVGAAQAYRSVEVGRATNRTLVKPIPMLSTTQKIDANRAAELNCTLWRSDSPASRDQATSLWREVARSRV